MPSVYGDTHRAFLQACANHGNLNLVQALNIYMHIKKNFEPFDESVPDEDNLKQLVDEINEKLEILEQKLVYVTLELDVPDDQFIVFTNTTQTEILKAQGTYTDIECLYFKRVLEEIIQNDEYCLPWMDLLNLCATVTLPNTTKKITKQRAQNLIEDWCQSGYFIDINDKIHLGPRTIGEFGSQFRAKFPDYINSCFLCSQPTFKGVCCAEENCDTYLHQKCYDKYSVRNKKCPRCKNEWKTDDE